MEKDGKLSNNIFAAGNLLFSSKIAKINGYSGLEFSLLDLDFVFEEEFGRDFQKVETKVLTCNVYENFKEITNSSGQIELPFYTLTEFKVKELEEGEMKFFAEIFY